MPPSPLCISVDLNTELSLCQNNLACSSGSSTQKRTPGSTQKDKGPVCGPWKLHKGRLVAIPLAHGNNPFKCLPALACWPATNPRGKTWS